MTRIVRFADAEGTVRTGVEDASGAVRALKDTPRVADLLRLSADELRDALASTTGDARSDVLLLPPLDGLTEVWAAGVTYERSREGRVAESTEQSVYERVYDAERPELFFKSPAWRVLTDGEPIAVREDSELNVPEPELGLVLNSRAQTVGYVVANDVSSRSVEGENPLYLPQAKIYAGSTAVSSGIVPAWEVPDPSALEIALTVRRSGRVAYEATTSTAAFHRTPRDLVDHLFRCQEFPDGAVLFTGTGVVPGLGFTLREEDTVEIRIAHVGTLSNPVHPTSTARSLLTAALTAPLSRASYRAV
ncbi:fumarylacetoacetate hydrolase family protein [Streptomyces daliensis]|uniref:Fumarylacetoacetate hydrolase family protein n=1 Tax=Streptomyces daliensis TaxID=299421 RepID=A0A8T4ILP5_9ACTN|nr:fumarylacetoacetate hydrolase family protein [Streptomyces daliensis]